MQGCTRTLLTKILDTATASFYSLKRRAISLASVSFYSVSSSTHFTVMIPFSAWGDYLLLAPHRRALIRDKAVIRDRALIKKRALTGISFLEKAEYAKQSFDDFI